MNRRKIFDTFRQILGRKFRQEEVEKLDRVLQPSAASQIEPSASSCGVSAEGIQLIKRFEGCARLRGDGLYEAYPDPGTGGAPWTIGWGATGKGIAPGTVWTMEQCDERLERDVASHAREVAKALKGAAVTQSQFDALVSFHFNTGAIHRATLTRLHRAGEYAKAAEEFGRWKHAGGRVLKGLVRRRRAEAKLYRS